MRFVYSLIRFVPDPARGEFVNVGAIAGSDDSSEWQLRQVSNPARARALDDSRSLDLVWSFCNRIGADIDRFDESLLGLFASDTDLSEDWLEHLHTRHRNVVQLHPPTPMAADNVDQAMDRLFSQMIVDPPKVRRDTTTKHGVLAAMRKAYRRHGLMKNRGFVERARLSTGEHMIPVDFAVVNGSVLQLVQTWSFQATYQEVLAEQVRSWGWVIHQTRKEGARLGRFGVEDLDVSPQVPIAVVHVPRKPGESGDVYRGAMEVFDEVSVEHRPIGQADEVAENASRLLAAGSNRW